MSRYVHAAVQSCCLADHFPTLWNLSCPQNDPISIHQIRAWVLNNEDIYTNWFLGLLGPLAWLHKSFRPRPLAWESLGNLLESNAHKHLCKPMCHEWILNSNSVSIAILSWKSILNSSKMFCKKVFFLNTKKKCSSIVFTSAKYPPIFLHMICASVQDAYLSIKLVLNLISKKRETLSIKIIAIFIIIVVPSVMTRIISYGLIISN